MAKTGTMVFIICIGVTVVLLSFFKLVDVAAKAKRRRLERKWEAAKAAAKWGEFSFSDGSIVRVAVRRVASIPGRTEVLDVTDIGECRTSDPAFQAQVLDLQAQAYERAMILNSL